MCSNQSESKDTIFTANQVRDNFTDSFFCDALVTPVENGCVVGVNLKLMELYHFLSKILQITGPITGLTDRSLQYDKKKFTLQSDSNSFNNFFFHLKLLLRRDMSQPVFQILRGT